MAEDPYPTGPVKLMGNMRVGGTIDTYARTLARPLGDILGQPVVVVNKAGAGGRIGVMELKKAKPDGYTLMVFPSGPFVLDLHVKKVDYTLGDYTYIAAVNEAQPVFVTTPDKPYKNFKELVEYAKTHPGLTWGSLSQTDKSILWFIGQQEGIDWNPVPFKGGSAARPAILGGHVDFGFSAGGHYPLVEAGKLIILAQLGEKRSTTLPGVPTLKELGYNIATQDITLVAGPKGVPDFIVKKLSDALSKAVADPAYVDLLDNQFHAPRLFLRPDETENALKKQDEFVKKMIQRIGK
jgi:tripartite-type tricarboxylate transporter receptor subunit TctC